VRIYTDAWLLTGNSRFKPVVADTVEWCLREMKSPAGGFYAALDADSEGHEGKFYVWTMAEIDSLLDPDSADLVKLHFGVSDGGNFEGKSILHTSRSLTELAVSLDRSVSELDDLLEQAKAALLSARNGRVRPGTDTKVIVSWNALMIEALATAGLAFQRPEWIEEASTVAEFLWANGVDESGRLVRTLTNGQPNGDGMLEDHAFLARAFLALNAATGEHRWLDRARDLMARVEQMFRHAAGPGFYDTSESHEKLIVRPRELQDGAIPCGNSVALDAMLTIGELAENGDMQNRVGEMVGSIGPAMAEHPTAFGYFLAVAERLFADHRQLVLVGDQDSDEFRALLHAYSERYEPFTILAYPAVGEAADTWPTLANRPLPEGATAAAFLCQGMTCLPPLTEAAALGELLNRGPD
jgi:uncharacterized protein YyaL (SSP411 family)